MSHDFKSTGSNAYAYEMFSCAAAGRGYTVVRADSGVVEISARRETAVVTLEFDAAYARAVAAQLIAAADVAEATKEQAA